MVQLERTILYDIVWSEFYHWWLLIAVGTCRVWASSRWLASCHFQEYWEGHTIILASAAFWSFCLTSQLTDRFFFQNLLSPISGLAVRNGTSSCVQVFFVNRNNGATQLELPQAPLEDFAAEESRQIPEHRPQILSGTCAAAKHPWLMWKEGLARDALKQDCASKGIQ